MTPSLQHLAFALIALGAAVPAQRPDIVLVMGDDMGYTDVGCYGGEIHTPNLDRMAENGVRFTQFYNTSRCCPTRAALLTGLYSHQTGIGLMTGDRGHPGYRGDLNRRCVTVAEVLKRTGYATLMSGKWHVTRFTAPEGPRHNWPLQRGFDRFYGTIIGAGSFFDPATLCRGNTFITPENDPEYRPETFYYTDAISDEAARFVREHHAARPEQPLFLYVSYTSAHWPMHALRDDIERYRGRYDGGFDAVRKARYENAIARGVLDPAWAMSPTALEWESTPHKDWERRNMEVYAGMVDRMDQGIGRILAELERAGRLDNTLFVYLQDNGGCAEGFGRRSNLDQAEEFDFDPLGPDGLQDKIWPPMQTRDGRFVRTGPPVEAGNEDTFIAYGTGWANVSNTPFRGYKHDPYEGGIATPFIVHWPAGLDSGRSGAVVHDPAHLIDIMPTVVELAQASYPPEESDEVLPMEGVSLLPALRGEPLERRAPLCFEHHGNLALRMGRFKIASVYRKDSPRRWELYDMVADRTELHDLAEAEPDRLAAMVAAWQAWASRVGAMEWPFPNKKSDGPSRGKD